MKNLFFPQSMIRKVALITFLFITGAMFYAQDKTYASSQTNQITGLCLLCSIQNPQYAVGNNENDFTSINIPVGVGGKAEQTLIFPAATNKHFKKIVIGIGTPSLALSAQLLGGVTVESFLGNTPNNDSKVIDNNMLKIGQDPQKASIEFTPTKYFDRVKITLNGGILGLNDILQIYYAYHTPGKFTTCGNPPLDPLYYYPFSGNTQDVISGLHLTDNISNTFTNGLVCGQALDANPVTGNILETDIIETSISRRSKSISFWGSVEDSGRIRIEAPTIAITIKSDTVQAHRYPFFDYDEHGTPTPSHPDPQTDPAATAENNLPGQLNHYVITYDFQDQDNPNPDKGILCIYKNGVLADITPYQYPCVGHIIPFDMDGEIFYPRIKLFLNKANIDELIIYDRKLSASEVADLANSYGIPYGSTSAFDSGINMKIATTGDKLTVTPNPTPGVISLGGNIPLENAEVSIRNVSGKEVYRSKVASKTFDLPATLPGGIYMLTLQTKDKKVYTRKIILTR